MMNEFSSYRIIDLLDSGASFFVNVSMSLHRILLPN